DTKEPTLLKHGNDQRHEFFNSPRRVGHREHKAITTSLPVVRLKLVSYLLRRAHDLREADALTVHLGHFTQGEPLTSDARVHVDYALGARRCKGLDNGIEWRLGKIVAETAGQVHDGTFQRHQTVMQCLFVSGGLLGLRHERLYTKQDLAVIRMAPAVHHALFHVGVIPCCPFHKRLNGKNDFRMPGCEVPSASRCPSLNNHTTA